jgi:hypothetical protein
MTNTAHAALMWITNIISKHNISYQIAGGLAARAYGSTRPLIDIDIDIPKEGFNKIIDEVRAFITFGPTQYKDETWDIYLMTLNYNGQEIDISDANSFKIYNKLRGAWNEFHTDFSKVSYIDIYGSSQPVIPRDELITYKRILARLVDQLDLAFLEQSKT